MASELRLEVGKSYRDREGNKRGPVRKGSSLDPSRAFISDDDLDEYISAWYANGRFHDYGEGPMDLIAEWTHAPTGPVRTVTKREVVEGDYGDLSVTHQKKIVVVVPLDAARIRAAAVQMSEIADALEEQA